MTTTIRQSRLRLALWRLAVDALLFAWAGVFAAIAMRVMLEVMP